MKVAAIDTSDGNYTACEEAVLCERHDTPENRAKLERGLYHNPDDPVVWDDCSGNDACRCFMC